MKRDNVFEDWSIVAYLSFSKNLTITPFVNSTGRVAFRILGDIEPALSDIYSNKKVPINDYIKALKSVRNTIFTLRTLNK